MEKKEMDYVLWRKGGGERPVVTNMPKPNGIYS